MTAKRLEYKIQESILEAFKAGKQRLFRNSVWVSRMSIPARGPKIIGVGGKGGADLVGWATVEITPEMVGQKVAVFCAIEVKRPGQGPSPEQTRFIHAVQRAGGRAGVADNLPDARRIMNGLEPRTANS